MNMASTLEAAAQHKQVTLSPVAGFCVKSTTLQPASVRTTSDFASSSTDVSSAVVPVAKGSKVFINIAWDKNVPPPPEGSQEAIQKAMMGEAELDEWNAEGWFVPVVVSDPREDKDKAGKPSLVFDCVFNPSIKSRTLKDIEFKTFIVELALQRVESQASIALSRQLGTPNIASKGKLTPRTVHIPGVLYASKEDTKSSKKLIEEIPPANEAKTPKGILKKTSTQEPQEPEGGMPSWSWSKYGDRIRIAVQVPKLTHADHARSTLDVEPLRIILQIPSLYSLDINLDIPDAQLQAVWKAGYAEQALGLKRMRDFDVAGAHAEWRVGEGVVIIIV